MSSEHIKPSSFVYDFVQKYVKHDEALPYFEGVPDHLKIGNGEDSEVFYIPDSNQVMKFYLRGPWLDLNSCTKLKRYVDLTNHISNIAASENWSIKFKSSKIEAKVRINPYDEFVFSEKIGCFVGVSPCVGGVRSDEWDRYSELNIHPYFYEYKQWIPEINKRIEKALKVKGIDVFLMNAKLTETENGLSLTITDLNRKISDLKTN